MLLRFQGALLIQPAAVELEAQDAKRCPAPSVIKKAWRFLKKRNRCAQPSPSVMTMTLLFPEIGERTERRGVLLLGIERELAEATIRAKHYSQSIPSGKSHYVGYEAAIVVWSIPANMNIGKFLLGREANVWELSRLWAPDGHRANLLTEAISAAAGIIVSLERPEVLVSYADPNVGHRGGIYHAASWLFHGQSEESRRYVNGDGNPVGRRAFHSGDKLMTKAEIEQAGYSELKQPGKLRFVKPITRRAKRELIANQR